MARILFGLLMAAVFLCPAGATPVDRIPEPPEKPLALIMVCHCGKPSHGIAIYSNRFRIEPLDQVEVLVNACRSRRDEIGGLYLIHVDADPKTCPLDA